MGFNANITYKNNSNLFSNSFTSSYINPSNKGEDGEDGKTGTSLYFTNYDISNDYYKDIVLRKIQNNTLLSSDSDVQLEGRIYVDGDLVLTNDKYMYQISLYNNTYDIILIGKIQDENATNDYKDKILSVNLKIEKTLETISVNSNRTLSGTNKIYGLAITPSIYILGDLKGINSGYDYEFYLRIKLHNKKYMTSGEYAFYEGTSDNESIEYPLSLSDNNVIFYKTLEFNLNKHVKGDNGEYTGNDTITYFLSDMSMDKLHPSGNNIDVKLSTNSSVLGGLTVNDNKLIGNIIYDKDKTYKLETNYTDIKDLETAKRLQFENKNMRDSHTSIQFPREIDINGQFRYNFRGGESAYFSGMLPSTIKINNVTHKTGMNYPVKNYETMIKNCTDETIKDYVCEHIKDFILSENNTVELICVNTNNNWCESVEIGKDTTIKLIIED